MEEDMNGHDIDRALHDAACLRKKMYADRHLYQRGYWDGCHHGLFADDRGDIHSMGVLDAVIDRNITMDAVNPCRLGHASFAGGV